MEASALHAPGARARLPLGLPLLRLRSDEQLLALFRAGSEDAFGVIHDRYRQRLFAYVRQMLSAGSRQDAEDVLQDVFVRAYGALRSDAREVNLRAWLYRVAHNRCIDHLRRPVPPAAEVFEVSRKPLQDPLEEAQRREDLTRLVEDIGRLPDQQRSALLMREIDGMPYSDLSGALGVTVPAVKSLLVRARVGLVESAEARDADCAEIRRDLLGAYDRGVKSSGRARRHMRGCDGCREYRSALRGMRRSFAALTPVAAGPLLGGGIAKLLGIAGGGGGAAAGGAVATGGVATVSACKVAAVVCATALTAGGAVEVRNLTTASPDAGQSRSAERPERAAERRAAPRRRGAVAAAPARRGRRAAGRSRRRGRTFRCPAARTPASEPAGSRRGAVPEDELPIAMPLAPPPGEAPADGRARPSRRRRAARPHPTAPRRKPSTRRAGHGRAAGRRRPEHAAAAGPAARADAGARHRSAGRAAAGRPARRCCRSADRRARRRSLASRPSTATSRPSSTRPCSSAAAGGPGSSRSPPSTRPRAARRSAAAGCGRTATRAPRCATRCGSRAR